MRITKGYAKILDKKDKDSENTAQALRLTAAAWRICAIIATADPERGKKEIGWLLFKTLPWVDGESLKKYISEREDEAAELGIKAGIFKE